MPKHVALAQYKHLLQESPDEAKGLVVVQNAEHIVKSVGDPGERVREFILSSQSVDRDGDTVDPDGWDLGPFSKSGVFLWAHDYSMPPIGDPQAAFVEPVAGLGKALKIRVKFSGPDLDHPLGKGFGHTVMRYYDEGLLKATSAGFRVLEANVPDDLEGRDGWFPLDITKAELLEGSAVPVPSNRDCLLVARSKGLDTKSILNWAEESLVAGRYEWLDKAPVKELLDSGAKVSVTVPEQIEKSPNGTKLQETDEELETAITAAMKAEGELIDRASRIVASVVRRGRFIDSANEEKLRALKSIVDEALAEPEEIVVDPDADEEPSDEDILKAFEARLKQAAEKLHFETTGGLPE